MQIIQISLSIVALLIGTTSFAQDKIYKVAGDVIDAKVKKIEEKTITYKRFDNPDGPEYVISKDEVTKIQYQNGSQENYSTIATKPKADNTNTIIVERKRTSLGSLLIGDGSSNILNEEIPHHKLGRNIIAIAPILLTENGNVGTCISYERLLDADGTFDLYLPVGITFINNNNNSSNYVNTAPDHYTSYYFSPGLKIYPRGNYGKVRYALGPSIDISGGKKLETSTDNQGNYYYSLKDQFVMGVMMNNSFNLFPTTHVYIGIEFNFGFSYINQVAGSNAGTQGLVQFALKMGYRY
ncbi:MAG: hypothetical protein WCG87_12460 [Bacteroidota bacterium]